jgi:protein-arginine kinase activator protein McsA
MINNDIEYLKIKLEEYILNEEYEKAATIRDWIIEMQNDITSSK